VAVLVAGCGSSNNSSSTSGGTNSAAAAATTAAASRYGAGGTKAAASTSGMAVVVKGSKLGTIMAAGPHRLTVYLFEGDHGAGSSACTGPCAAAWPPVTSAAAPVAGSGVNKALLGSITRSDGTRQVTYAGHPLYFFARDKDDGDAYGQGVNAFGASWYVIAPSGSKVDSS
jgi:predicted lipoprotein with Yx(FWY)xxD motif